MHDSNDEDGFEHFEGMSKEEFQEWLYENRHLFGEIFEEFEEYDTVAEEDDGITSKDGSFLISPFGAAEQKFAELMKGGAWICYTN